MRREDHTSDSAVVRRRVVVVEDHPDLRERIAAMLAQTCDIVGTAGDGRSALTAIALLEPDVIVLDISLPDITGLEIGSLVRRQSTSIRLVFDSVHDDEEFRLAIGKLGRSAFVLKGRVHELVAAVNG